MRTLLAPVRTQLVLVGGLVLLLGVLGVYWPVLDYDFVRWDDDISVTQNPLITEPWSVELAGQLWGGDQAMRFKPLHWMAGRVVHEYWGFDPRAWHAFNLGCHALATGLFYLVLWRMMVDAGEGAGEAKRVVIAGLGAAIWAVHPLRAEPVAWVTGSTYPFTTCWLLGSFLCYLKGHARATKAAGGWLAAAAGLAVAGYASYPIGVTYGLWLMAVDTWWLGVVPWRGAAAGRRPWGRWLMKHACFMLPALAAVAITLWARFVTPGIFSEAPDIASVGLGLRLLAAGSALGYLGLSVLWPVQLTPNLPPLTWSAATVGSMLVLASLAVGALGWAFGRREKRPRTALFVWGFAVICLPSLGLTERPTWPVDRYTYLPQIVLLGGVAVFSFHRLGRTKISRAGAIGLAMGLLIMAGVATRGQIAIWRDSRTLFTSMRDHPGFTDRPGQQAHVYLMWARFEIAGGHPQKGADLTNTAQQVYLDGINAAVKRNDYSEALLLLNHLEYHLGITPVMKRERGYWLLQSGRPADAQAVLREVMAEMPADERTILLWREATGQLNQMTVDL
ncbi:hypothetical protein [Synoicihabitans lomoniglobus]|uniref:Tetratricopeptide repeat protein n=1 Tax=Synoicihabitans lomoniglobus TaxID=2909285 RepID=A0AAF0CNI8_9BACT|nr:hypothetical protein [Opitutaceae bacterium LMO-M01]WED64596.1 hypothetical protein PXH66_19820 [Opitutaceae bacterium LMO-M01]